MKYFLALFSFYIFLLSAEVFINLMSPFRFKIPVIFPLLITIAILAPFRSRFHTKTALPLLITGAFALETISATTPGLVFGVSFGISLLALVMAKHYTLEEDFKTLIIALFFSSLFERFLIIALSTVSYLQFSTFLSFLKGQIVYLVIPSLFAIVVGLTWFVIINWKKMKTYLSWLNFQSE